MNFKNTMFFFAGLLCSGTLCADDNPLNRHPVEGEVVWFPTAENKMRDTCFSNVFHSITTNGFIMKDLTKQMPSLLSKDMNIEDVVVEGADFQIEGGNILFEVGYFTTKDKVDGGGEALAHATYLYSTAIPPWFQQWQDGPGNLCLLPRRADINEPTKITNVFFCRDNVAIRVRNFRGGDVLAFAKLLDECILASAIEEPQPPPQ